MTADKYVDDGDVDLDEEIVRRRDGTRITEAAAREQGERIAHRGPGRPSLSAPGEHSPQVSVRITPALKRRLDDRAKGERKRPSDVIREALERYV